LKAIISPNTRVRHPDEFVVGEDSIVDDFCYFSTRVRIGRCCHVASGCSVAGGRHFLFELNDFSSLSAGVKVWCTSDDFRNDLVTIIPSDVTRPIKHALITGDVVLGAYTAVGANSVIMPNNRIPEGTVIGALSFVPPSYPFEDWAVYAGTPIRRVGARNRLQVLSEARELEQALAERS
jgi:acetyltransferase-like isoleucine patch superfamily enzyme